MRAAKISNVIILLLFAVLPNAKADDSRLPIYENDAFSLEVDFRIGGDTEDEDLFLYQPSAIAVDSKGNLFVLDFGLACTKKYSPRGKHLGTFGGEGEGPGKLSAPARMSIDPSDNVVVYEAGNRRFSIFNSEGEFVDSRKFIDYVWDFDICPKGYYYVETRNLNGMKWVLHERNL